MTGGMRLDVELIALSLVAVVVKETGAVTHDRCLVAVRWKSDYEQVQLARNGWMADVLMRHPDCDKSDSSNI